ncbi:hypothetical protein BDV96DRAFT_594405 [Lophiotrema nucula]|uniref:Histidine kinase HHK8p n=1 Tax=Lophiotrema nucula TaxID=690887 RepID=A0A6A5ZSC3_9PLEO|nr:hypothetical protein BDV96DRAFT_594405 [Lophiotrema nucula]
MAPQPAALDLDILEFDSTPTFVIRISASTVDFDILFCNEAFRKGIFRDVVQAPDRSALLFRSWAQAINRSQETYQLGHIVWSAEIAGRDENWKIVRAMVHDPNKQRAPDERRGSEAGVHIRALSAHYIDRRENYLKEISASLPSVRDVPQLNLTQRWETLQTMMEMSDVGVFEYSPDGTLIHGNEAWYRLSSHPRELPAHSDFSFMDLVYPDDTAIVMSAWNTLVQGKPVTFEMRWKARPGTDDVAQWVLSSCLPVYEDGNLFSIAGNTIDINAQKKSQEAAVARVEALEMARSSERKFARFAELAPIAIYIFTTEKGMQYVNDQFFELTGHDRVAFDRLEWSKLVCAEDLERVEQSIAIVKSGKRTADLQFRLNKTWVNQEEIRSHIWVQSSSYPEVDKDGNVMSVMGTLFDISQFKWAETVQRRMIDEALEAKRQQENFIDMTSHELRNPLSAVVQCADSVISTLHQLNPRQLDSIHDEIDTCIDSLQTIVLCSLHQKRIIDDVLTLSKLDSNLILITPIRVQPAVVVSEALKMFEVECSQMQITLEFKEDETLEGLEWVMLDPSRLLQVLINLLTNAIKFTKGRPTRKITVTLGGTLTRPPPVWHSVTFTNTDGLQADILDRPDWGDENKAFIWLKVEDTGCGLSAEGQKKLFSRFQQATPKTHVKYGGSGLGLFISKSLTVLQGGSIGVNSELGVGSTFAFYVSTRLAKGPKPTKDQRIGPQAHRTVSMEDAMKRAKLNILLVEDNVINQTVLSKQLIKFGCKVHIAGNGIEALEWLRQSVYWQGGRDSDPNTEEQSIPSELDIILMDVEMPVMDGLTCARLIRDYEQQGLLVAPEQSQRARQMSIAELSPLSSLREISMSTPLSSPRKLPILAVSANARSEQIEQARAAGMDDAIAKPFRILELWPKMEALIQRCHSVGLQ